MAMKLGHVRSAFPANKLHFSKNFRGVFFRSEGTVVVLLVAGGHQDVLGNFDKMLHVGALRTGDTPGRFTSGNMDFLHRSLKIILL